MICGAPLPVTSSYPDAAERLSEAIFQLFRYTGDPLASVNTVLTHDSKCAVAVATRHSFFASGLFGDSAAMAAEITALSSPSLHPWEQRYLEYAAEICKYRMLATHSLGERNLMETPEDVFTIRLLFLSYIMTASFARMRRTFSALLAVYRERRYHQLLPFIQAMAAFGEEECGNCALALEWTRESVLLRGGEDHCWAAHTLCHVYETLGEPATAIAVLEESHTTWKKCSLFAAHIWWHMCLFHIDLGNFARSMELYDEYLIPDSKDDVYALGDRTSVLVRLLLNTDVDETMRTDVVTRAHTIVDLWKQFSTRMFDMNFVAIHMLLSLYAASCDNELEAIATTERPEECRWITQIARALLCLLRQEYAAASSLMSAVQFGDVRQTVEWADMGGSNAQRSVLTLILWFAKKHSGSPPELVSLERERHLLAAETPHNQRKRFL